jgi:hypothetical protein
MILLHGCIPQVSSLSLYPSYTSLLTVAGSLTESCSQLNKGTQYSKLTKVLDECKALELSFCLLYTEISHGWIYS